MATNTCDNCSATAVYESKSRTASRVQFCARHAPANVDSSPNYRRIKKRRPKAVEETSEENPEGEGTLSMPLEYSKTPEEVDG